MAATDPEREALTFYLHYQRTSVQAIVAGLDEALWHTPALPSGWTVAGMIQHLGEMEGYWWRGFIEGHDVVPPDDEGRPPNDGRRRF